MTRTRVERDAPPGLPAAEARLVVTARVRARPRIDPLRVAEPPLDPPLAELLALAASREPGLAPWLSGGEPTLRADLPELVRGVAGVRLGPTGVGLRTDGLALVSPRALAPLVRAGLARVRITLHAGRPDAHDWLVGLPGAARRAIRALGACVAAGLAVEIEALVTRPTAAHLAELATLAAHLGAPSLHLGLPSLGSMDEDDIVALACRWGVLGQHLAQAAAAAAKAGLRLWLHGFPLCIAPELGELMVAAERTLWLVPDAAPWRALGDALGAPDPAVPCAACPGPPRCAGAPADHLGWFGRGELPPAATPLVNTT